MDGGGYEEDGLFKGKNGVLAWQVWQYGMKSGSVECGKIREFWGITRVYLATAKWGRCKAPNGVCVCV